MNKAEDLRIGNYVENQGNIVIVKSINEIEDEVILYDLEGELYGHFVIDGGFEYIPLTESELEKLGIEKEYYKNPFEENGYDLNEDGSRYYSWVKGCFNLEMDKDGKFMFEVYSHYIPLDYVHQLQNLFYLLTNEELTYIK